MKKIYVINCNAKENSLKTPFVEAYIEEVQKNENEVRTVNVYDLQIEFLNFNGNEPKMDLSDELKQVQQNIIWADQIVFVYPVWCLGIPAKLKALIERIFQENVLVKMGKRGPEPILQNKTMVIIQSYAMPVFFMKYFCKDVPFNHLKVIMSQWCGFKIEKRFDFGCLDCATEKQKQKWEKEVRKFASKLR